MQSFSKTDIKVISSIFTILFIVSILNLSVSIRRGRDSIRKNDISAIQQSLDTFLQKYGAYPQSTANGEIIGCFDAGPILDDISHYPINVITCKWGESSFESVNFMPRDPSFKKGMSYLYKRNDKGYEIYIALEGKSEAEYSPITVAKNLHCGSKICNYGRVVK